MLDVYEAALRDMTDEDWRRAVLWAEANCTFMPRPADLRKAVNLPIEETAPPRPQDHTDPLVHGVPLREYLAAAATQGGVPEESHRRLLSEEIPDPPRHTEPPPLHAMPRPLDQKAWDRSRRRLLKE